MRTSRAASYFLVGVFGLMAGEISAQKETPLEIQKEIEPPPSPGVSSLTLTPAALVGGDRSNAVLTLSGSVIGSDAVIRLSSSNPSTATVPPNVTVKVGSSAATFMITTRPVPASTAVTIEASFGGTATSAQLKIDPAALKAAPIGRRPNPKESQGITKPGVSAAGAKSRPAEGTRGESPETKPSGSTPPPWTQPTGGASDIGGRETDPTAPKKSPPLLSYFNCHPGEVAAGTSFTCTAGLEQAIDWGPIQVDIASSNSGVAYPANQAARITIPTGSRSASLNFNTQVLPQSASVTISASLGQTQRSATVKVLPKAIKTFACYACDFRSGEAVRFIVYLTAPAPASGYSIPLTPHKDNPQPLQRYLTFTVKPGSKENIQAFIAPGVADTISGSFAITDPIDGSVRGVQVRLYPPGVAGVSVSPSVLSQVPLGGMKASVNVTLKGPAPSGGLERPVQYGGTTDIQGPATVRITGDSERFEVNVSPCGVNPPCTVWVEVGGRRATITVNP